jgi:hypothetical protein
MKKSILIFFIVLINFSCNKKSSQSTPPKITFNRLSTAYFQSGYGNAKVSIFFNVLDIEGDVGFNEENIYLVDSRTPNDTQRYISPIIPTSGNTSLKALFETQIEGGFLIARKDSPIHYETDTLFWTIAIKDKAGNRSNFITTSDLILYH